MGYQKAIITAFLTALTTHVALANGWDSRSEQRRFGHHHRPERHWRGSDWVAPLVILGVTGAAVAAASRSSTAPTIIAPPPPVYAYPSAAAVQVLPQGLTYAMPPQAMVTAPNGVAYYCPTYGQYHPQVQACPGGWQLVSVSR